MEVCINSSYYVLLPGHKMGSFSSDSLSEIRGKVRPYPNDSFINRLPKRQNLQQIIYPSISLLSPNNVFKI